jgi:2-hydroxychromene-2-carboxylate isomerase
MNRSVRKTRVRFLFDPLCPWAYRASLWVREVAELLPLEVAWEPFSLEFVNRGKTSESHLAGLASNRQAMRLMAHAARLEGQAGVDSLYLELGKAVHERKEKLVDEAVLARALANVGLPLPLLGETRADPALDIELEAGYARAAESGAFGVPTLYIDDNPNGFYGPLIDSVPEGIEAVSLWQNVAGLIQLPYFYELKRSRR